MQASYILQADLLDIIFENRNKAYGAYPMRKFYERHVLKSLGVIIIMMGIFSLLVLTAASPDLVFVREVADPRLRAVAQELPVVQPKENRASSNKGESNKIILVDSLPPKDSVVIDIDQPISKGDIQQGIVKMSGGSPGGVDGPPEAIPVPVIPAAVAPPLDINRVLEKADVDPSYPGGLAALTKFMERNLENPAEVNEGESVSVKVKFVVGFDGELKAFEVKEDGGELFNKEVIRVLKKMPRWIPGKTKGQNVSVYFTIPVKFINGQ